MGRRPRLRVLIPLAAIGLVAVFALVGALTGGRQPASSSGAAPGRAAASQVSTGEASAAVPQPASADGSGAKARPAPGLPQRRRAARHRRRTPLPGAQRRPLAARRTRHAARDRRPHHGDDPGDGRLRDVERHRQRDAGRPSSPRPSTRKAAPETGGPLAPTGGGTPVRHPHRARARGELRRGAASASPRSATCRASSTSSEDVTSQYVDLQARLRHYRAVERRLVRFLAATGTIPQMLAVQDRIDRTQLTDRAAHGAAQVAARDDDLRHARRLPHEKGAHAAVAGHLRQLHRHASGVRCAVLGHGARVTGLVAHRRCCRSSSSSAPSALAAWYVTRRLRRGRRQPTPPSLPA